MSRPMSSWHREPKVVVTVPSEGVQRFPSCRSLLTWCRRRPCWLREGIADGRGVAAALALGAAGALIGTRFQASVEALVHPSITNAIIEGRGEDTERSTVLDIARGSRCPSKYPARTLGHPFLDMWRGREEDLAADADAKVAYQDGVARGELLPLPAWASESTDLINELSTAADLVETLAADAEVALAHAGSL